MTVDADTQLGVFAKHCVPGRVKTRLAATIGPGPAANVAQVMVQTITRRLAGAAGECVLAFTPVGGAQAMADVAGRAWRLESQHEGDLGERMEAYFASAFGRGRRRVVLIGADSPDLPLEYMSRAFNLLNHRRLVLGPTDDGGYYLIGARDNVPPVFRDMPWGGGGLWSATTARLGDVGWVEGVDWAALPRWYDIDTADDLARLRRRVDRPADSGEPPLPAELERLADRLREVLPSAADC